jgi:ketosteroid isomerase-like protein
MNGAEKAQARDEIRQLAYRYAHATDTRDLDTLVGCFIPEVQVGRERTGREALRADFDRQLRAIGITILFVGNHLIDFVGPTHATGHVYCRAEIQEGERWIHQAIRYDDTYEKHGDQWYFVRRKHQLFYGAEPGQNPLRLPPADWPKNSTGRGTLPESENHWQEFWKKR